MFERTQALLFDLDGTLIDSTADLTASGNHVRHLRGMDPLDEAVVASYIGDGVQALVARLLESEDPVVVEPAVRDFIAHYHDHCLDRTALYPGVRETLQQLAGLGFRMAVVTNKPERISAHIIDGLGLSQLLPVVVGGNSGQNKKPDPEPLRLACARLGAALERAVMIGDSHVDVQAARNAGIPCVALAFGIGDSQRLAESAPDQTLHDFESILPLFSDATARS